MSDLRLRGNRPAHGELAVVSPYDGRELERVATAGLEHVNDALDAAYGVFRDRSQWLSVPQRVEILNKTAAIMF